MTRGTSLGLDFIVTFLDSSLHTVVVVVVVSVSLSVAPRGCSLQYSRIAVTLDSQRGFTSIPLRMDCDGSMLFIFLGRIYGGSKRFCKLLDR